MDMQAKAIYRRVHFIVVNDYPSKTDEKVEDGTHILSTHEIKCMTMRGFFKKMKCKVHRLDNETIPNGDALNAYIAGVRDKMSPSDLMIIYYDGKGFLDSKSYWWQLSGPNKVVDAEDLILGFEGTKRDVLFILDCYVPDKNNKWTRTDGCTEVFARSANPETTDGYNENICFTYRLVLNLRPLLKCGKESTKTQAKKRSSTKDKLPHRNKDFSLAMLLSKDQKLRTAPLSIYLNQRLNARRIRIGAEQLKAGKIIFNSGARKRIVVTQADGETISTTVEDGGLTNYDEDEAISIGAGEDAHHETDPTQRSPGLSEKDRSYPAAYASRRNYPVFRNGCLVWPNGTGPS